MLYVIHYIKDAHPYRKLVLVSECLVGQDYSPNISQSLRSGNPQYNFPEGVSLVII